MNDNNQSNKFKFSLTQENVILCEKIFEADDFNPFTRYSIDIRDILPKMINILQKEMSQRRYDVVIDVGNGKNYDILKYNNDIVKSYPFDVKYNPEIVKQEINVDGEIKYIRGVECKIGLYINDNPIVERVFYVDGFNPVCRYSLNLVNTVVYYADIIYNRIYKDDIKNIWDDYDLINRMGLTFNQIRELQPSKRAYLLSKIN
ncbi:MAG: hypothetical protein ACOC22_00980 [bacterium]